MKLIKCDLCNKVVSPNEVTCQIAYVERKFFGKKGESNVVGIQKDFCVECQDKIVEAINNLSKIDGKIEDKNSEV